MQQQIVIYSQAGCPNCDLLARKLDSLGIEYTKKPIDTDYQAKAKLVAAGIRSVPAISKGDSSPIPGPVEELVAYAQRYSKD